MSAITNKMADSFLSDLNQTGSWRNAPSRDSVQNPNQTNNSQPGRNAQRNRERRLRQQIRKQIEDDLSVNGGRSNRTVSIDSEPTYNQLSEQVSDLTKRLRELEAAGKVPRSSSKDSKPQQLINYNDVKTIIKDALAEDRKRNPEQKHQEEFKTSDKQTAQVGATKSEQLEKEADASLHNPEVGHNTRDDKMKIAKRNYYDSHKEKIDFFRSAIFPEYGDPKRFPGAGLTAVGKYWTSFNVTPAAGQTNCIISFSPQDFNSNSTLWLSYSRDGDLNTATAANRTRVDAPYPDKTVLERARVTSACMIVKCVNASTQNAAGVIATSYQPKPYYDSVNAQYNLDNESQRDIEQAVNAYNGNIVDVTGIGKAIWVPMDTADMQFQTSGHDIYNKNVIACYISNTNSNTTYRVDVYVNYEYMAGKTIEDVVTVESTVLSQNDGDNIYKGVSNVLRRTGNSFLGTALESSQSKDGILNTLWESAKRYVPTLVDVGASWLGLPPLATTMAKNVGNSFLSTDIFD